MDLILARAMVARYAWQLEDPTSGIESLDAVLAWLDQAGQAAEARGWLHWAIKARLVETLARQAVNDSSGALAALHSALAMAEPGGYIRLFADEMPGLAALLRKIATGGPFVAYARRILAASYPGKIPSRVETSLLDNREGAAPRPEVVEPLVEPLSKREMEVLRLLAKGATNAEIANQLVVAPSTAKKHVIHILGKLGVSSRSKAIHRARELGLID
ncbi:MAG: DNA-binding response regulator [Chloroflexi bacterium]|nr:MAG: DNA-binding response regulator [Chloroflexota bacterium]